MFDLNLNDAPCFAGIKTFMKLNYVRKLENEDFIVMGVPFDTGTTNRSGQRLGPQHIRNFSPLLRPYNTEQQINIFEFCTGADYGDINIIPGNVHRTYENIVNELEPILEKNIIPILIGGDHSISLAHLRAMAKRYGPISLVHFDSHCDTWDDHYGEKYMHGTPFRRAVEEGVVNPHHSIQIGIRGPVFSPKDVSDAKDLGYEVIPMKEVRKIGCEKVISRIKKRVSNRPVFISYDIDFLDPSYAPGTGTPEVGGVTSYEALEYVRGLEDMNVVGFDLVEVLPAYDFGEITAIAAASILYEMITLVALQKRKINSK